MLRAALAAYQPPPSADRAFALTGCAAGDGRSVADMGEDELLRGFGS